ncbi:Subtilisin-chymotrypsin inhibitor CI-1B [Zea mays]|uniref:Subtilisin-chymotrypsin inhibitor CI-1B n=1 Tax=Zea mays TaxID=4577 RepID=A0A1D6LHV5_MAIZE|nr:Subtilisin-chymotrypsin inhibitor CI-1B [Zea mays]
MHASSRTDTIVDCITKHIVVGSEMMSSVVVDAAATSSSEKKTSWPEVVGMSIKEATETILKDMPNAYIQVLPVGSPVTLDLRPDRVRIFVDTVAMTPTVG